MSNPIIMYSPKSPTFLHLPLPIPNRLFVNKNVSLSPLSPIRKISQTKLVDPLDFEKYILENQPLAENDPETKLLEFPDDDIEVTTIHRQHRTVHPYIPKDPGYVKIYFPYTVYLCICEFTFRW